MGVYSCVILLSLRLDLEDLLLMPILAELLIFLGQVSLVHLCLVFAVVVDLLVFIRRRLCSV